jgi:hypothetical protein
VSEAFRKAAELSWTDFDPLTIDVDDDGALQDDEDLVARRVRVGTVISPASRRVVEQHLEPVGPPRHIPAVRTLSRQQARVIGEATMVELATRHAPRLPDLESRCAVSVIGRGAALTMPAEAMST